MLKIFYLLLYTIALRNVSHSTFNMLLSGKVKQQLYVK